MLISPDDIDNLFSDLDPSVSKVLKIYSRELADTEILDAATERALIKKYQTTGCLVSRDAVVKGALRYVLYRITKIKNAPIRHIPTMIAAGNLALFTAIDRFDPDKAGDSRFILYARWHIDEAFRREWCFSQIVAGNTWVAKRMWGIRRSIKRIEDRGDKVTPESLAEEAKISVAVAARALQESLKAGANYVSMENLASSDMEAMQVTQESPATSVEISESQELLHALISTLPPKQAAAVRLYYGVGGIRMSSQEIGNMLNNTHQFVDQLLNSGLSEVRNLSVAIGLDLRSLQLNS